MYIDQKSSTRRGHPRTVPTLTPVTAVVAAVVFLLALSVAPAVSAQDASSVLDLSATDIHGEAVDLSRYRGDVVLIVNTASKCGFTYQFGGLQEIYERYGERGFVVLGFPSDNFAGQEYDSDEEIFAFCTGEYDVTFPMFSKVDVTGGDQHPVYRFLTAPATGGAFSGPISWNFNKFLVGRDGEVIARFDSPVEPDGPEITAAIEAALESDR